MSTARARAALEPVDLEELSETGLITVTGESAAPEYRLRPHAHLLLAGDGSRSQDADVVSAFTGSSMKLERLTPRGSGRSMLEVGTGSGVVALLAAAHFEQVTATDVNPRALMFAGFNAALNDIANLELLEGSWFEPVAGRRFDLIVSNPPYVVSPDRAFTYRDSGLPGAALLEHLIKPAAEHLEPGGLAIVLFSWPHESEDDWASAPTAAVAGTGCDALILGTEAIDPFEYAVRWNSPPVSFMAPDALRDTVARWLGYYRAIGAGAISYGTIVLRRRTHGTPWVSTLKTHGDAGERAADQLIAMIAGRDLLEEVDEPALLARRFSLPDGVDISQRFQRRQERFVARPAMVRLEGGLGVSAAIDPDALDVLFACDGRRTLSEVIERVAQRRGADVQHMRQMGTAAVHELLTHGLLQGA